MRMHIELDDGLMRRVDELTGPRARSAFVRRAVEEALDREERRSRLAQAAGAITEGEHDWDDDPGAWVRNQRRGDRARGG